MKNFQKNFFISLLLLVTLNAALAGCGQQVAVVKATPTAQTNAPARVEAPDYNLLPAAKIFTAGRWVTRLYDNDVASLYEHSGTRLLATFNGVALVKAFALSNVRGLTGGEVRLYLSNQLISSNTISSNINTNLSFAANLLADDVEIIFRGTNIVVGEMTFMGRIVQKPGPESINGPKYEIKAETELAIVKSSSALGKKDFVKAEKINLDLLQNDPKNPYANMNLGQIYMQMSKLPEDAGAHARFVSEALSRLDAADIRENPKRKELLEFQTSVYRTELLGTDKVLELTKRALELSGNAEVSNATPAQIKSWVSYGDSLALSGKMDEAIEYDEKMFQWVKMHPAESRAVNLSEAMYAYGTACLDNGRQYRYSPEYVKTGRWEKLGEIMRLLIDLYPKSEVVKEGHAWRLLAVSRMALGLWAEAIEAWKGFRNYLGATDSPYLMISYCYIKLANELEAYNAYILHQRNKLDYVSVYKPIKDKIYKEESIPTSFSYNDSGKYDLVKLDYKYINEYKKIIAINNLAGEELVSENYNEINTTAMKFLSNYSIGD